MGILVKDTALDTAAVLTCVMPAGQIPTWVIQSTAGDTETISVSGYSNAQLSAGLVDYLQKIQTSEAEEIAEVAADKAYYGSKPSLISVSGRGYIRGNYWYTGADDTYGYGYYQHNESAGTGADPLIEWEHLGIFIPAGRVLERIHIVGRTNNTSITDIEFCMIAKTPDAQSRWETGIDNDNEITHDEVFRDFYMNPTVGDAFTGTTADMHRRTFELNYTSPDDRLFGIYVRPTATNTSTRYFYHTWTLEVS